MLESVKDQHKQYAVRFRPSLMARIIKAAAKAGVGMAEWIRSACVEKLER